MEYIIAAAIILALLFTSAFFSGGELAMMALDEINIETGVRKNDRLAKLQKRLRSRPQRFLSTILIGYNVANISLATFSAGLAHRYLSPLPQFSEEMALTISAVVMTVVILIFAELMPKTIAAINSEGVARWVTYPLYICDILMTPLNLAIEKLVMPLIYLLTGGRKEADPSLGREELATALSMAHAKGDLHTDDMAMATEAISLSMRDLADVMTPRVDVVAIQEQSFAGDALALMLDSGFTRLPIYRDDMDEITGMLLLKDLVRLNLRSSNDWENRTATSPARKISHMPQTRSVVEALSDMQRERFQLVVVVDEHGGTAGIVTLEDIVEELVGEILDESDKGSSADIIRREEGLAIVSGRARIEQIPELSNIDPSEFEAGTVGGLLMELLGRAAVVGDSVEVAGAKLIAVKVLQNRIKLVRIEVSDPPVAAVDELEG